MEYTPPVNSNHANVYAAPSSISGVFVSFSVPTASDAVDGTSGISRAGLVDDSHSGY